MEVIIPSRNDRAHRFAEMKKSGKYDEQNIHG
jgi:hypothetical protein